MSQLMVKIINAANDKPRTKSQVLALVKRGSWPGYASSHYVEYSLLVSAVWAECIARRLIFWTKGQKVIVTAKGIEVLNEAEKQVSGRV